MSEKFKTSIRRNSLRVLMLLCGLIALGGCEAAQPASAGTTAASVNVQSENSPVWMSIGDRRFAITLADTEAARAFAASLPLTIDMPDLNSNEKHAELSQALPTSAVRPGTIRSGDLMLYGSRTLVLFYLTFDSIYSYTRLGRLDNPADLAQILGKGTVRITFSNR